MKFDIKSFSYQFVSAFHNIFEAAAQRANNRIGRNESDKRDRIVTKDGGYKCIHLPPEEFLRRIEEVLNYLVTKRQPNTTFYDLKFLDIGCGVGEKIYLAWLFGLNAFGLELRKQLITEGQKVLRNMGHDCRRWWKNNGTENPRDCFIQANALTYDYSKFDILYFYCPLFDNKLQEQLEIQIAKTAKPGAIVIGMLAKGKFCYDSKIEKEGWRKIGSFFIREA